jgi:hypothetical protein
MTHFDVVGDVDGELDGDVMGELEGDVDGDEIVGVVRRNPRTGRGQIVRVAPRSVQRANSMQLPPKPQWRKNQVAPGVQRPTEDMWPLPLKPMVNNGIFTSAVTQITWQGQLQKPFRGERFLVEVSPSGTSAQAVQVMGQQFVGVNLQQAEIDPFNIALVGRADSFGTRLTLNAAEPGVLVRVQCFLAGGALTGTDQVFVSMMWLGRVIS